MNSTAQQAFDECEYIGPAVFTDLDGRNFFGGARVHNMIVSIGDCVQVVLEGGDEDERGVRVEEEFGFCQVLAIYDEDTMEGKSSGGSIGANGETKGEGVQIEARWFITPDELDAKRRKLYHDELLNELLETDILDDIPIGSVAEHIKIRQGGAAFNNDNDGEEDALESYFVVRYTQLQGSTALQPVQVRTMLQRGMTLSHYQYAYVDHLASLISERTVGVGGDASANSSSSTSTSTSANSSSNNNKTQTDIYSSAIRKLHVSVLPVRLPCRQLERDQVYNSLRGAIENRGVAAKPLYVSGMPGTGKTATVLATVNELKKEVEQGKLPDFNFLEINCLRLQAPAQAYTVLWRGINGAHASSKVAKKQLESLFENASMNKHLNKSRKVTVCLVDELDFLLTRDEEVVYNFFNWPLLQDSIFVVIGIANVMDLPERLHGRVSSRMDLTMQRMVFKAYDHKQIQEILQGRLEELSLVVLNKVAMELVSRKAATVAGDLRAALKICQRTIELHRDQENRFTAAIASDKSNFTSDDINSAMYHGNASSSQSAVAALGAKRSLPALVNAAAAEYKESPMMATVARMCLLDKALLCAGKSKS